MKNTKIKAALAAVLLSVSGSVFAVQDEVNNIALAMLVDTPITKNLDFEQIVLSDDNLVQKFERLSISQKYDVLNIVRSNNMKNSYNDKNTLLLNSAVSLVVKKLRREGIFFADLSNFQLKSLIVDAMNDFKVSDDFINSTVTISNEPRCPLKIFDDHIDYSVKPKHTSYASPYYYSNVVTKTGLNYGIM